MSASRRTLAVRVSDDAREAIEAYCRRKDITVTAWVEAIGTLLRQLEHASDPTLDAAAEETVRLARAIDKARRSRA